MLCRQCERQIPIFSLSLSLVRALPLSISIRAQPFIFLKSSKFYVDLWLIVQFISLLLGTLKWVKNRTRAHRTRHYSRSLIWIPLKHNNWIILYMLESSSAVHHGDSLCCCSRCAFCICQYVYINSRGNDNDNSTMLASSNHVKESEREREQPIIYSRLCSLVSQPQHNWNENGKTKPNQCIIEHTIRVQNSVRNGNHARASSLQEKCWRKTERSKRRMKDKREEWNASTHHHYLQYNKYNDGFSVTQPWHTLCCTLRAG